MRSRSKSAKWLLGISLLLATTSATTGCAEFLADLLGIQTGQNDEMPNDGNDVVNDDGGAPTMPPPQDQMPPSDQPTGGGGDGTTAPDAGETPAQPSTPPTVGPGSGIEIASLKGLRLNARSIVLTRVGETFPLEVVGVLSNGATKTISNANDGTSYENSNAAAVSVSPDGLLTAIGNGAATITATNGGFSVGVPVLVDTPDASAVFRTLEVSPTTVLLLDPTQTQQLVVTGVFSDGSRRNITSDAMTLYSSNNTGVVNVSPTGLLTPVADGDAFVTVNHRGTVATVGVQVAFAARLLSTSPGNGDGDVSLRRETIVHFSTPIDKATLNASNFFATFGGAPVRTNLYISKDGTSATLFYPDGLPPSARVRVTLNGDAVKDKIGRTLDADGDGAPGGTRVIDFDTLSIAVVPGTAIVGRVFASELAATPGGGSINRPLEGVTISVDGASDTLKTTTDAFGNFRLDPAPGGRFFVHVDGRTATVGVPAGAYYPYVGKAWDAHPGKETNVGDIYLPLVPADALTPVSPSSDTEVSFSSTTLGAFPEFVGTKIMIPADSLFSDDGTRGGKVGIAPVPPDRLPGQLPEDLKFPLVITVQTDGATNFDRPAPVCFPNLEGLPPGATTALWSFNHDIGTWEIVGQCTISADGRFACSNPGVGIRAPGWHGIQVGVQGSGGGIGGGGCNTLSDNAEDTIVCVKKPVTFCAVITGGPGKIDWTGGGMPASGSGTTFTTTYDTPGVKTVTAKLTPDNGDPPVMDSGSITVIKIEIMDDAGNTLDPMTTVTDPELTTVAQQVSLKAKITPDVPSATKEWKIGGSNIRTYEHDIDEQSKHKTTALMDAELKNKTDIKFFWTDSGSGVTVSYKVKKGASECEETIKFDVMQDPDPNHNIYCANGNAKKNPNGDPPTMPYRTLFSHHGWHGGMPMDDGAAPVHDSPTRGDGTGLFNGTYDGSAFLLWHWEFIKAHLKWRSTFNVGALMTPLAPPGASPIPDYLKANPPAGSTQESELYGYVRLGEFKDLSEVGRDTVHPWHNFGHGELASATGDPDMGNLDSPRAEKDLFWAWHSTIDGVRAAYTKDQAMTTTLMPADGATVAGPVTEIIITFDKRVSNRNGMGTIFDGVSDVPRGAVNTEKITAGALKVNGSAATAMTDVGGAGSKFMVYRFTGFAAPANGAVTVELTGTGSYAGKTWTFTQN